jgi:hypothetical protein
VTARKISTARRQGKPAAKAIAENADRLAFLDAALGMAPWGGMPPHLYRDLGGRSAGMLLLVHPERR